MSSDSQSFIEDGTSQRWRCFLGTTDSGLSGVNTFNRSLATGLLSRGWDVSIICTNPFGNETQANGTLALDRVCDLQTFKNWTWHSRWRSVRRFLESRAPCFYLPNHDEAFSAIAPQLHDGVHVVGVLHSDDEYHYRHLERMGDAWNACVCVSHEIAEEARRRCPQLANKIFSIPNGVRVPPAVGRKEHPTLRLICASRLEQHQKRILDLVEIVRLLSEAQLPFSLTIAGSGTEEKTLRDRIQTVDQHSQVKFVGLLTHSETLKAFEESDVFLMTSEFEGLSMSLLEAMARSCVPVVSAMRRGVAGVIEHGSNGLLFPVGDARACVEHVTALHRDRVRMNAIGRNAREKILNGLFQLDAQVSSYLSLFEQIRSGAAHLNRSHGRPRPPDFINTSWKSEVRSFLKGMLGLIRSPIRGKHS